MRLDILDNHYLNTLKILRKLIEHCGVIKKGHPITDIDTINAVNHINNNLKETEPAKEDMSVYSGIRRDPQQMVKDSGGILHHPAFISTSIDHEQALKFSVPTPDESVKHVLKIKIRKGQRVGSYIGEKSTHSTENEYLIKANNMLHITPEYDIHIGKNGEPIKIHHAIVLEPHEYEHLIDNKEVHSKKDLDAKLSIHKDEINRKIDKDIENNRVDDNYLQQHMLEPHHIDNLLQHSKGINSSIIPLINDKFREYNYEAKSHILNKVKEMKNNDDTDWMKFTKVHPMMGLSNVDKFKVDYNLTERNTPIDIKMNDEELHNELHPWVNKQINKNLEPHEASRTLAKLAHVINKEQTEKLLDKVGSYQNIFINLDSSGKKINKHVADAILDHSIKHNNFQSIKGIIHHLDLNNLEPRHEEYLKNHPGISDLDSKGVFAKHVVDKAIKDNDIYKLRTLSKVYNRHYSSLASEGVKHLLNNIK